jgi:hypothetical protein
MTRGRPTSTSSCNGVPEALRPDACRPRRGERINRVVQICTVDVTADLDACGAALDY